MHKGIRAAMAAGSLSLLAVATSAHATAVTLGRTETNTDYVSAGVGGVGGGSGTISVTGVTGDVRKAFLYWHGIDNSGTGAVYDNADITFDGTNISGTSLGDAETNCWGSGSSRAFFADVTALVDGNGDYPLTGLSSGSGHSGNGASLIVLFDDGNPANNRDLVFFEGNDSDLPQTGEFPDDPAGWAATLPNIGYTGGSVFAQIHAGDGQTNGTDGSISFMGTGDTVTVPDDTTLWDGLSVPNAGSGRFGHGLWDIHTFDITNAFGAAGEQTINFTGMTVTNDCHSLVTMMLDLAAGSAPCGNGVVNEGEECDPNAGTETCGGAESCLNDCTCGCEADFQCNDGMSCTIDTCNTETGACEYDNSECGCPQPCGDPINVGNITAIDAAYVLRTSVELEECLLCVCDVDDNGEVLSSDALRVLQYGVDLPVTLMCPDFEPEPEL